MAPTAAEQEEESQLGMLIFHELTYLRNGAQAPVGLRGLALKLEEQGGGGIKSVSSLQGLHAGGTGLRGEISKLG